MSRLQGLSPPDEDAIFGAFPGPHHDGGGGGQSQGTGTGDNEDRHKVKHGVREGGRGSEEIPDDEGDDGDSYYGRDEVAGDDIGQPGNGGFGTLGLLHHLDDLGEHGVLAHLGGLKGKSSRLVDGGTDHLIPRLLLHRDGFSCDHRLVHRGVPVSDNPIHGDLLPGPHYHEIPDRDFFHGDIHLLAFPHNPGCFRLQPDQFFDSLGGLTLGSRLEKATQEDKNDDGPGRVEIDLGHQPLCREKPREKGGQDTVDVSGGGAHSYEGVHIRGLVFGGLPRPYIELPSYPELDGGLKNELKVKIDLPAQVIQVG